MKVDTLTPGADGRAGRTGDVPAAHREHRADAAALPAAGHRLRRRPRAAAAADRAAAPPAPREEVDARVRDPRRLRRRPPLRRRRGGPGPAGRARRSIAAITVTVGTIDDVAIAVVPSTIRAHRRASFRVDIDNRSATPDRPRPRRRGPRPRGPAASRPGRAPTGRAGAHHRAQVKGPRHLVGEPRQHSLTVTARSDSAPSYAPATFQQRPLFPRGLRSLLAVLLVVGDLGRRASAPASSGGQPPRRGRGRRPPSSSTPTATACPTRPATS